MRDETGVARDRMTDFDRQVFCLAGLPFDAISMEDAVKAVRKAADRNQSCFLSTPNLNFLIGCQEDAAFRDSVIHSDLSIADGMPVVWLARLLGIPIRERVAGSDLFEWLRCNRGADKCMLVYFFGGPDGVAERACSILNAESTGMRCAGFECPGFGSIDDMSGEEAIARINASKADLLVVALGARKGQAWIECNRDRITVPVISHLGAVVNFVAGSVTRAPAWIQRAGLEWLWRIKEEPALWKRYWKDGIALTRLLITRVLPYRLWLILGYRTDGECCKAKVVAAVPGEPARITVEGCIPMAVPAEMRTVFSEAASNGVDLVVDLTQAGHLSPGFFGLLLMLKKHQDASGRLLRIEGAGPQLKRHFYWNGVEYLLAAE